MAQVPSLGQEELLEYELATHSSILENTRAHYFPWAQEPGRATVMGPQRHD